MSSFFNYIKTMLGSAAISEDEKGEHPENIAPLHTFNTRRDDMTIAISNDDLIKTLRKLKADGISYRCIAKKCGIKESTFYNYLSRGLFPYPTREIIADCLEENFKEILIANELYK